MPILKRSPSDSSRLGPTHAGGVVYRKITNEAQYLLVRAHTRTREWVFPKGHIESAETIEQAALREVLEESGVRARIKAGLGELEMDSGIAAMFLMVCEMEDAAPAEREITWLTRELALNTLTFEESRKLLISAHQIVERLP